MTRTSRITRFAGSVVFLAAGASYIGLPPTTTAAYFGSEWVSRIEGIIFALGAMLSMLGLVRKRYDIERYGIALVMVATGVLVISQLGVMFEAPVTWSRAGGITLNLGFGIWALSLYAMLGRGVSAVEVAANIDREEGQ